MCKHSGLTSLGSWLISHTPPFDLPCPPFFILAYPKSIYLVMYPRELHTIPICIWVPCLCHTRDLVSHPVRQRPSKSPVDQVPEHAASSHLYGESSDMSEFPRKTQPLPTAPKAFHLGQLVNVDMPELPLCPLPVSGKWWHKN